VDDVELGRREEEQRSAQLLRELARQVQRNAAEVGVAQQVVQVVREQLKDETQVRPEHELPLQLHCSNKWFLRNENQSNLRPRAKCGLRIGRPVDHTMG